jgi:hypothetical protein
MRFSPGTTRRGSVANYHFETEDVLKAIANTDYAKGEISRHLHAMTCDQRWSLYRAIVKLADEGPQGTCKHCGEPVFKSMLGIAPEYIHHNPLRLNCFMGEPWRTPEPVDLSSPGRTLFVCDKCGEEVGDGEQDHNGRHPICGGSLSPIGECADDSEDFNYV